MHRDKVKVLPYEGLFWKKDLGKTSNFKKIFAVRYTLNYSTTLGRGWASVEMCLNSQYWQQSDFCHCFFHNLSFRQKRYYQRIDTSLESLFCDWILFTGMKKWMFRSVFEKVEFSKNWKVFFCGLYLNKNCLLLLLKREIFLSFLFRFPPKVVKHRPQMSKHEPDHDVRYFFQNWIQSLRH